MKIFSYGKDGGDQSTVWGFWLIEIKSLFSIALLCFEDGSREAYHSHAFNSISWVLRGRLTEVHRDNWSEIHKPSLLAIFTPRTTFHKVTSHGRTWVLTFRGPWANTWREYLPNENRTVTMTHGRKIVS